MKKKKFPKKAKLITDGGFYKIITINNFIPKLHIPLMKQITLATPETGALDIMASFEVEFVFERVFGKYAEYRQINVASIVK